MNSGFVSIEKAISCIKSYQKIFIHSAAAAPQQLIAALCKRSPQLKGVEIYQIHTEGEAPYAQEQYQKSFTVQSFFIGKNIRSAIKSGLAHYIPVFLSEIPHLFRCQIIPLNVALIQVSPPDQHGYCSLGPSVDCTLAAVEMAETIIAEINPQIPRTHGHQHINIKDITYAVEVDYPLPQVKCPPLTLEEMKIGQYIAELIENGSTLQMGIGNIPNAVLNSLSHHQDLGIHTEMFSDGVVELVEKGIINGKYKVKHPGKIVSSFVVGTKKVYDFIDNNPNVFLLDCAYTNDTSIIRKNPKVVAINSAIAVDLTGQVCADSIGPLMYSGVGGQMDFMRGASLSDGGKPIIAFKSKTRIGESKIVPYLMEGSGVVTTRAHVHYVVTENGVADLYGKNIEERAKSLIKIAAIEHQEALERQWKIFNKRI